MLEPVAYIINASDSQRQGCGSTSSCEMGDGSTSHICVQLLFRVLGQEDLFHYTIDTTDFHGICNAHSIHTYSSTDEGRPGGSTNLVETHGDASTSSLITINH